MLNVFARLAARPQSWSIRGFLIGFAIAVLLPLIGLSFLTLRGIEAMEVESLQSQAMEIASGITADIDKEVARIFLVLEALITSPHLEAGQYEHFYEQATTVLARLPHSELTLLDRSLAPIFRTSVSWGQKLAHDVNESLARQARDEATPKIASGAPGSPPRAELHLPVRVGGGVRYILVLSRQLQHLQDLLVDRVYAPDWARVVVDPEGHVLAQAGGSGTIGLIWPPPVSTGDPQSGGRSGDPSLPLKATSQSRLTGWTVHVLRSRAEAKSTSRYGRSMWLMGTAGTASMALGLVLLFGHLLAQPIRKFAEAVSSIGRGQSIPHLHFNLAEANSVAEALTEASQRLRQRTRALKEARDEARRRAQEAEEARSLLATLLENVPSGITIALGPPEFPIVANSRMAAELCGRTLESICWHTVDQHAEVFGLLRPDGTPPRVEELPIYRACQLGETTRDEEWLIERPDGSRIVCLANVTPLRNALGEIVGAVNCWWDVTARKAEEAKLQESVALAKAVSSATSALIYVKDREGRLTMANAALLQVLQLDEASALGKTHFDIHGQTDRAREIAKHERTVRETASELEVEELIDQPDGPHYYLTRKSPVLGADGSVVAIVGVSVDITDRKRADAAARLLSEIDSDNAWTADPDAIVRRAVNRLGAFLGVARCHLAIIDAQNDTIVVEQGWLDGAVEIEGSYPLQDIITPEFRAALVRGETIAVDDVSVDERTRAVADLYLSGGLAALAVFPITVSGAVRALLVVHSAVPRRWRTDELRLLRDVAGRVWTARERALAAAALRTSEERYRLAALAIQGMIYDFNIRTGQVERSPGLESLIGFRPDEVEPLADWWRRRCHPEDSVRVDAERRAALAERRNNLQLQYRVRHRDGYWVHVEDRALIVYDGSGSPMRAVGSIIDITGQIHADARLRETEERFRALVEASAQTVWTTTATGEIVEDSPSWRAFTGQTVMQFLGWGWFDAIHPQDRAQSLLTWRRAVASRAPVTMEYRLRHHSGEWRWTQMRAVPLNGPDGVPRAWVGMNTDITERRNWEEQQKLLLGELSHRVKNVLAVVQSMATRTLTGGRSVSEASEILIRRLHALSRAHDMLTTRDWRGAPLRAIVEGELAPFAGRTRIDGPDIMIGPRMAQTLALALHELATNATKHGALSNENGHVCVTWSVLGAGANARFAFKWCESGGPPVEPPMRKGFGSALLSIAISGDSDGPSPLRFEREGVIYEINVPLSSIA